MRALAQVICFLFPLVAFADVSKGRYELEKRGPLDVYSKSKRRLPSCGPAARDLISNFGKLAIRYSDVVSVNDKVWKIDHASRDAVSVVRDDLLEGLLVQIEFWQSNERTSNGALRVVGLGGDEPRCADSVSLSGTFKP
jgi:hypothetical protein